MVLHTKKLLHIGTYWEEHSDLIQFTYLHTAYSYSHCQWIFYPHCNVILWQRMPMKSPHARTSKGPSIIYVGNLEGEGSKVPKICRLIEVNKFRLGEGGCQKGGEKYRPLLWMIPKHFFSARLCAEASVVKAYGCTSLAGLTGQAEAGRAGRADEALVRQHCHRHSQYIEHTEHCHFSCGISNVVGPKKQDIWPKINILKVNHCILWMQWMTK